MSPCTSQVAVPCAMALNYGLYHFILILAKVLCEFLSNAKDLCCEVAIKF